METFTRVPAFLFLIAAAVFSCNPYERVAPQGEENGVSADGVELHPGPAPQCANSQYFDIVEANGNTGMTFESENFDFGSVEITNDVDAVWLMAYTGDGWYIHNIKAHVGPRYSVPMNAGLMSAEQFNYQESYNPARALVMYRVPYVNLPELMDIAICFQMSMIDEFSQPVFFKTTWAAGRSTNGGYCIDAYRFNPCPSLNVVQQDCYFIQAGSGGSATIEVAVSGGVAPFTYSWSNGATTAQQTVSPSATTTYTATVTDALGNTASTKITVCADAASCPCAPSELAGVSISPSCPTVLKGLPLNVNNGGTSSTLNALATDAVGSMTYFWSTGATTSSIQVSPNSSSSYSVTVTDSRGISGTSSLTINAINIRCGNTGGNNPGHKVTVCHLPPGNPANMQEICIDWSGVPAHVAEYRDPNFNPLQGHDSGCKIGPCGVSVCY